MKGNGLSLPSLPSRLSRKALGVSACPMRPFSVCARSRTAAQGLQFLCPISIMSQSLNRAPGQARALWRYGTHEREDRYAIERRTGHSAVRPDENPPRISRIQQAYKASIADPEAFWGGVAKELDWFSPWSRVLEWNYPWAKWFVGATCNIAYNCLDRHANGWRRNKVAIIWVGENGEERIFTYGELLRQVNRCAMPLKRLA